MSDAEEDGNMTSDATHEGLAESVKEQMSKKRNSVSITDNESSEEEMTEEENRKEFATFIFHEE